MQIAPKAAVAEADKSCRHYIVTACLLDIFVVVSFFVGGGGRGLVGMEVEGGEKSWVGKGGSQDSQRADREREGMSIG